MRTKEITIESSVYVIKEIGTEQEIDIRNESFAFNLPKSRNEVSKPKVLTGTYQIMTIWAGLEKWPVETEPGSGIMMPIILENVKKFLPRTHLDLLFEEIDKFNSLTEEERKNS